MIEVGKEVMFVSIYPLNLRSLKACDVVKTFIGQCSKKYPDCKAQLA